MNRDLHRPAPVLPDAALLVDRTTPPAEAARRLRDGEVLLVRDMYSTGAEILAQLQSLLQPLDKDASYALRHAARRTHREAALRLLAPIANHRLALGGARQIGFLEELYPELSTFFLPFVVVQELYSAWGRYEKGVHLPVLGYRVHLPAEFMLPIPLQA